MSSARKRDRRGCDGAPSQEHCLHALSRRDLFGKRRHDDHQPRGLLDRPGDGLFLRAVRNDCGRKGSQDRGEMHPDGWGGLGRTVFSSRVLPLAKIFLTDVLLQRRLYRQSRSRWVIHSLIFYPFMFRSLWGMIALIGSLWKPQWSFVWPMLDKNRPVTAFLFDLTGILLILGMVLALIRGARGRRTRLPDLPNQDRIALTLIGGVTLVGFVLEGMRIAMTGFPGGAEWAFAGYGIAEVFGQGSHLTNIYGYLWYLHALLAGAFIAYIPFSRLLHVIFAPLVLARNAARESSVNATRENKHRGA